MRRLRGFEFEDQPWFPPFLRQYMMDFLRFVLNTGNLYKPVTPILAKAMQESGSNSITDLCSGAGGAVGSIQQNLLKYTGQQFPVLLTDLYPNLSAYRHLHTASGGRIQYYEHPVNAASVPAHIKGFRTIFSGFHHFDEDTARQVLRNAADAGEGIAIFDGGNRSPLFVLLILLFHPIAFLLFTPFIKPFSWRRLLFTYLLPVVPVCTIWDGIVSVLRLYSPDALLQLANETQIPNYTWKSGTVSNALGMRIAFLTGVPKSQQL